MHPPWIILFLFINLLTIISSTSGDEKELEMKEEGNSTSRKQREIIERERRLIPYMTYYLTQNLNPNVGARQNVFIPLTSHRGNILQYDSVPQIQANNIQSLSPQQFDGLSKPVMRLQNPSYITAPSVQIAPLESQYTKPNTEDIRVLEQIYALQPGPSQSRIQPQPVQSETQPQQVIKVNPVQLGQKYVPPQLIKIIPIITKVPAGDRSPKSFNSPRPQYTYTGAKLQTLIPNLYTVNDQNYYQDSGVQTGNKIYTPDIAEQNLQPRIPDFRPNKSKYAFAKILISSTTPTPYTNNVKFELSDARNPKVVNGLDSLQFNIRPLNPTPATFNQDPITVSAVPKLNAEKYVTMTPSQQQIYYTQTPNEGQQGQIHSQDSQDFVQHQRVEQIPRLRVPHEEDIQFVAKVTPIPVTNELPQAVKYEEEEKTENTYKPTLDTFLSILKETTKLPQNLTPDNIDNGIKTLALILERLQQEKKYHEAQAHQTPPISSTPKPVPTIVKQDFQDHKKKVQSFPQASGTSTPGRPGIDYPIYSSIPQTNFDCSTQRYKGFFGDPDTNCQVWHYCDLNGGQASFLCPNGTIFSQVALTCDWWFNVKCASTSQLYVLNERLYKYILPFSPSFPEDYSGPIVDRYLAAKFKEMEAKSKIKALKALITTTKPEITTDVPTEALEESQTTAADI